MEAYYAECLKPHQDLEWNFDCCQEFISSGTHGRGRTTCQICHCHRSHHRWVVPVEKNKVVKYDKKVVYTMCNKVHADLHNSVDGCQEFLPSKGAELTCAACTCHKSFHRNEITTSTTTTTTTLS